MVETHDAAVLTVSVTHPKMTGATQELVLPGNTQPLIDAPIYARTNGYLKKWYADIGDARQSGRTLAEIETPEVDHQLQQARADLETAQANLNLAQITADRMVNLEKKGAVARQDTDNVGRRHELEEGDRRFRRRQRQAARRICSPMRRSMRLSTA